MRDLTRNRSFVRFWLAGFFVSLAQWVLFITIMLTVYRVTGSSLATGAVLVCEALPGVLLGPVAGALVDRWDRARVMRVAALALAVLMLAALATAREPQLTMLYVIVVVQASILAVFGPAEHALLPRLVPECDLAPANAMNAMNDTLGNIIGPSVGAALVVYVGFDGGLLACAALYLAGWAVIRSLRVDGAPAGPSSATELDAAVTSLRRSTMDGLRVVASNRMLRVIVAVFALYTLADVPLTAVLPVFVGDSLGVGETAFGTMLTIRGITGLLGAVVVTSIARRVHETHLLAAGLVLYGASIASWGVINTYTQGLLITVPVGLAAAAIHTGVYTHLQKASADATRGRVFGLVGTVNGTIVLGASLAAGGLAESTGTRPVVILSGCLQILPFMLLILTLRPWRWRPRR